MAKITKKQESLTEIRIDSNLKPSEIPVENIGQLISDVGNVIGF